MKQIPNHLLHLTSQVNIVLGFLDYTLVNEWSLRKCHHYSS